MKLLVFLCMSLFLTTQTLAQKNLCQLLEVEGRLKIENKAYKLYVNEKSESQMLFKLTNFSDSQFKNQYSAFVKVQVEILKTCKNEENCDVKVVKILSQNDELNYSPSIYSLSDFYTAKQACR